MWVGHGPAIVCHAKGNRALINDTCVYSAITCQNGRYETGLSIMGIQRLRDKVTFVWFSEWTYVFRGREEDCNARVWKDVYFWTHRLGWGIDIQCYEGGTWLFVKTNMPPGWYGLSVNQGKKEKVFFPLTFLIVMHLFLWTIMKEKKYNFGNVLKRADFHIVERSACVHHVPFKLEMCLFWFIAPAHPVCLQLLSNRHRLRNLLYRSSHSSTCPQSGLQQLEQDFHWTPPLSWDIHNIAKQQTNIWDDCVFTSTSPRRRVAKSGSLHLVLSSSMLRISRDLTERLSSNCSALEHTETNTAKSKLCNWILWAWLGIADLAVIKTTLFTLMLRHDCSKAFY